MLELLTYQNNEGEVLISSSALNEAGVFIDTTDLRDFSWKVLSINDRITGFSRKGIKEYKLPCKIRCNNADQGRKLKDRLYKICEKDILANKPGRLWVAGSYMWCWVTQSKKNNYLIDHRIADIDLVITTDKPYWVKEYKYEYRKSAETPGGLNFPFNFPHDLGYGGVYGNINATDFYKCDFKIIIYGPTENPEIHIGDNVYKVNYQIGPFDTIEIDSLKKTLVKKNSYDVEESILFYRDTNFYIFEKIDTRKTSVVWNNYFDFDVIIYDTRSEPTWEINTYIRKNEGTDTAENVYINNQTPSEDLLLADEIYY